MQRSRPPILAATSQLTNLTVPPRHRQHIGHGGRAGMRGPLHPPSGQRRTRSYLDAGAAGRVGVRRSPTRQRPQGRRRIDQSGPKDTQRSETYADHHHAEHTSSMCNTGTTSIAEFEPEPFEMSGGNVHDSSVDPRHASLGVRAHGGQDHTEQHPQCLVVSGLGQLADRGCRHTTVLKPISQLNAAATHQFRGYTSEPQTALLPQSATQPQPNAAVTSG
jgi:hypothetical protein